MVHAGDATKETANGRTRKHNRGLRSHRASTTYGDGRRYNRRPTVVSLDETLVTRQGIKDFRYTMTDVVADDELDEECRK